MPRKAAGERTSRIRRTVAASTFAAAALALAAGCSGGGGGPIAFSTSGASAETPTASSAAASPSPAASDELTEPAAATTGPTDDETTPDGSDSFDDDTSGIGLYPTLPNATPYSDDTCFDGPKITSTTPIDVYDMEEVDCSSSDAHYQVVKTILDSTDLNACSSVNNAQYAFSESDTDGYGVTTWSAVYCLVGLGSYSED